MHEHIGLIKNAVNRIKYKVEMMTRAFTDPVEITGNVKSFNFNIDTSSDIRRTCTMSIQVPDESFVMENFEIGLTDRIIRITVSLMDEDGEYVPFVLGSMLLSADAYNFDATTNELSLTLVDMLACGTQDRGSQIGYPVEIPYESVVKNAINAVVGKYMPIKSTDIADFDDVIPYDLTFESGVYPIEILKTIIDLWPEYEQYYDAEGVYHVQQIPMRVDEPCLLDENDLDDLIISEKRSFEFSGIKNSTEIWGKEINADFISTDCEFNSSTNTYDLTFPTEMETVEVNKKYTITPDVTNRYGPYIHIDLTEPNDGEIAEQDTLGVYDEAGNLLKAGKMHAGIMYVVLCTLYTDSGGNVSKRFIFQGEKLIHVIVRNVNMMPSDEDIARDKSENGCNDISYTVNTEFDPDDPSTEDPFACDRRYGNSGQRHTIFTGEIRQVLQGGDYSAIYTTDLAYQRGRYENYLKTRLNTDVELTTLLIPFIDVNQKIQYHSPTTGLLNQYLVKSVTMNFDNFTMTMKLSRFFNFYPW